MAKKCVSCGTDLPNDAGFCTECGAQQPEVRLCKQCGALLEKDALFCGECGAKYEDPNKQQTERPVIKATPVTELKEEKKVDHQSDDKYCCRCPRGSFFSNRYL